MIKKTIIGIIHLYRWLISPFLSANCRFTPTCSRYAINALECHGVLKGLWLITKRLLRCHPYYNGNIIDEVSDIQKKTSLNSNIKKNNIQLIDKKAS